MANINHSVRDVNLAAIEGYLQSALQRMWPVGSVFTTTSDSHPSNQLGFGAWEEFGAGRVLVGLDSGDVDFDTLEETGGAKTAAHTHDTGTLATSAHAGTAVADHAAHTHSVTSNVAVANHSSHTHTYTEVPNHTHPHNLQGGTTPTTTGINVMASDGTTGSVRGMAIDTSNPTGGVATGTTAGPSAALSHSVTNNAVTSGNPSATLTHSVTQPNAHTLSGNTGSTSSSTVQPYIVVQMWRRTA
jgi:hypothetical protein